MKKNLFPIILIFVILSNILWSSCHKEGSGGRAAIIVTVRHIEGSTNHLLRGAQVGLKYGSSPVTSIGECDQVQIADTNYAKVAFTNLYKGDYYVFADGIDSVNLVGNGIPVSGGMDVKISKRTEVVEVTLPTVKK